MARRIIDELLAWEDVQAPPIMIWPMSTLFLVLGIFWMRVEARRTC